MYLVSCNLVKLCILYFWPFQRIWRHSVSWGCCSCRVTTIMTHESQELSGVLLSTVSGFTLPKVALMLVTVSGIMLRICNSRLSSTSHWNLCSFISAHGSKWLFSELYCLGIFYRWGRKYIFQKLQDQNPFCGATDYPVFDFV